MIMIININMSQLLQLKSVLEFSISMYMLSCKKIMTEKTSILLSDISIDGNLVEKDKIIVDAKINGDITAQDIETHSNSNIKGNISAKIATLGGKHKGNVNSEKIKIKKSADIEGVLNQRTISIEEGSQLKIKTETYK